jgi:hypothetical protein
MSDGLQPIEKKNVKASEKNGSKCRTGTVSKYCLLQGK